MANPVVRVIVAAQNLTAGVFRQVETRARAMAIRIRGIFTSLQGAIGTLGLALGAGAVVRYLVDANVQFQQLQARLQTFTGSAESARAVFDQLTRFAATTPFELQDAVEAFIALRSAGIQPTEETLRRLGDQASAFGGNIKDMAEAVRAATTGEMERLKQFGVVARLQGDQIFASFNGQTTVIKRDAVAITNYLEQLSATNFGGAMAREMHTLGGQISNLKDNLFQLATQAGENGASGAIMELLGSFNAWLEGLRKSPGTFNYVVNLLWALLRDTGRIVWNLITLTFRVGQAIGVALLGFYLQAKIAILATLDVILDATNRAIEGLNALPGVEIKWRAPDLTPALREAQAAYRRLDGTARDVLRGIGTDLGDIVDALGDSTRAALSWGQETAKAGAMAASGLKETGLATGAGSGAPGQSAKALADRIKLLTQGLAHESTYAEALRGLIAIDAELARQLAAGNVSYAERIRLEQQRAAIAKATGVGPVTPGGPVGDGLPTIDLAGAAGRFGSGLAPAGPAGDFTRAFDAQAAQVLPMTDAVTTLDGALGELAANGLAQAADGFYEMFEAIGQGENVFAAFGKAAVKSVAQAAQAESRMELGRAFAAIARSFNPLTSAGALAEAAGHFKAAALFGVLGGAIGAAGGSGGGGGRGSDRDRLGRDSDALARDAGTRTLVIRGGPLLDMNDPRQAEALEQAVDQLGRGGRLKIVYEGGVV